MALETELAQYEASKPELIKHHNGKFVLIIGSDQIGTFDRSEDAYRRGVELKGNVPMLIKRIEEVERIEYVPAMVLGLINAHT